MVVAHGPAVVLYDENKNPVGVILDGVVYRLQVEAKVINFPVSQAVTGPLTDTQLRATAVPISAAALPLPAGAASETTLDAILDRQTDGSQHTVVDNFPATQTVAGTVAVSNQPSQPLTDTQLRASAVPVSATSLPLPAGAATEATLATRLAEATFTGRVNTLGQKTMAGSTPVAFASDQSPLSVTGPLTDAQLRAVPVPISGGLTDAQLRATAVPVSLSSEVVQQRFDIQSAVMFIGSSALGTASSAAMWTIKKIDLDGNGNPIHARWTDTTAVWDDRLTENYS